MYLVREDPVQEKLDALKAKDNHALSPTIDWTKIGVYKVMKDTGKPKLDDNGQPLLLMADNALLKLELENCTYKFVIDRKGRRLSLNDLKGAKDGKN